MTKVALHERAYRALVRLYPREFRQEYGDELVQFFRDDMRQRGGARGWGRAVSDLVVSVPIQHVEATVNQRRSPRTLGMLAAPIAAGIVAISFGHFVVLLVPLAFGVSIAMYLSSRRSYNDAVAGVSAAWWRVLTTGVAILAAMAVADRFGPEMDWFPWYAAVLIFLTGWALIMSGAVLALVHLRRSVRRRPTGLV